MGKIFDLSAIRRYVASSGSNGLIVVYFYRKCYSGNRSSDFSILKKRYIPFDQLEDIEKILSVDMSKVKSEEISECGIGIYVNFAPLNIEAADAKVLELVKSETSVSGSCVSTQDMYIECLRKTSNREYTCIKVTTPNDSIMSDSFLQRLIDRLYTLLSGDPEYTIYSTWCGYYILFEMDIPKDIILPQYEGVRLWVVNHTGYMPLPGTYEGNVPVIEISSSHIPSLNI